MSDFAHNSENNLAFIGKLIICCCHGNQFITYQKCKCLLLGTSHIASVTWLWDNSDDENPSLPSSKESVYVHILVHVDKCITKRLKYTGNKTIIWRHQNVIHQFNWSKKCHKDLPYLYKVNKVIKRCIQCEYLVTEKFIENNFKIPVWWRHNDVITLMCKMLQSKDRACSNDHLLKV